MISNEHFQSLELWADAIRRGETLHHNSSEPEGTGIEVVFDGLCEWSYRAKVKLPWKLFGTQTREVFLIFQKGLSVPLATASLAQDLIDAEVGKPNSSTSEYLCGSYNLESPENLEMSNLTIGKDEEPTDLSFSQFSWREHGNDVARLENGSFVCRFIEGFEGNELNLRYIQRLRHFSGDVQDAALDAVIPVTQLKISIDGSVLDASTTKEFLLKAVDLLPAYWE